MKRTPGLIVSVLGILALHRLAPVLAQPTRSASIQTTHSRLSGIPADESGDDDGEDEGDSGDSE
jgi:hypothetical protein